MARREYQEAQFGFATLPVAPPFAFSGMTTRLFPLRASLNALQAYCDGYLNIIPPELGRFKVALPYVFLMMIDYGRMSSRAANLGWIAQREVAFAVALEWYRVLDGRWVFHDWAWNMPFIFVDEDQSQALGRMVYGWPKVLVRLDPEPNAWLQRPRGQVPVATLSTDVFSKLYAGAKQEKKVFLSVVRDSTSPFSHFPPDLRSSLSPWMTLPNLAQAFTNTLWDVWRFAAGFADAPPWAEDRANNLGLMARAMASMAAPVGPDLHYNTINLKQFRSANDPTRHCYQAVTNARMVMRAFNGGGPLGEAAALSGDMSCGYSVNLKCWPSLPIVDVLGLEVHRWWRDGDVDVASLRPVFPIWYNADLDYNVGRNVAWRSYDAVWRDEWGRVYPPASDPPPRADLVYNTTLGPSASPAAGEFIYNGLTVRVLPLLAEKEKLREYLDRFLNEPLRGNPAGLHFEPWTGDEDSPLSFVYLAVGSCEQRLPKTNDVGSWPESELSFLIPVVLAGRDEEGKDFEALGLVPAFTFNSNPMSVIISTEVDGVPAIVGDFAVASQRWMDTRGPSPLTSEPFVQVRSNQIPVFGEGQEATLRCVVEVGSVRSTSVPAREDHRAPPPWSKYEFLAPDVFREARSRAFALLAQATRFKLFTLKQIRDIARPDDACFQSLVCVYRAFRSKYTIERIETPLYVRVHEYPAVPIVSRLGLRYRASERSDGTSAYTLAAQDPFWMTTTAVELRSDVLCYRAGDEEWRRGVDEAHFLHTLTERKFKPPPSSDLRPAPGDAEVNDGFEALWQSWLAEALVHLTEEALAGAKRARPEPDNALGEVIGAVLESARATLSPGAPKGDAPPSRRIKEIPPHAILRALLDLRLPDEVSLKRWTEAKNILERRLDAAEPNPAELLRIVREELVPALQGRDDAQDAVRACGAFEQFMGLVLPLRATQGRVGPPPLGPLMESLRAAPGAPTTPRVEWLRERLRELLPPPGAPPTLLDPRAAGDALREARALLDANLRHAVDDLVDAVARVWPANARRPS